MASIAGPVSPASWTAGEVHSVEMDLQGHFRWSRERSPLSGSASRQRPPPGKPRRRQQAGQFATANLFNVGWGWDVTQSLSQKCYSHLAEDLALEREKTWEEHMESKEHKFRLEMLKDEIEKKRKLYNNDELLWGGKEIETVRNGANAQETVEFS